MAIETILVRHGQTVRNPHGVLQVRVAARCLADHWTSSTIYHSPPSRIARQSLESVSAPTVRTLWVR